jgi:hypothetical protein
MTMLFYKAWIETRVRFFAGLIAAAIVCIYYVNSHAWLVAMWSGDFMRDPKALVHFPWLPLGIHEYGWYLWHYLYENYLQQVWALFAALFAFGGLIREKANGTVLFSLGLPVSRRRWLLTRLAVAFVESAALSLFAVVVVFAWSLTVHQPYSHFQVLLHAMLMVAAGVFMIALGNLCFTLFPGEYLSLILTLAIVGVPYLLLQAYMQHLDASARQSWLWKFDISRALAGPWQLTWASIPWTGLCVSWLLAAIMIAAAVVYGDRVDY